MIGAAPAAALEAVALLVQLTERLLDNYAAVLAAAGGRALQVAYAGSRQQLLQALFQEAVRMASAGAPRVEGNVEYVMPIGMQQG